VTIPGLTGAIGPRPSTHPVDGKGLSGTEDHLSDVQHIEGPGVWLASSRGWVLREGDISCAVAGNVDWLDKELANAQTKRDPAHALLQAFRVHGPDLLQIIGGRFAICVWDQRNRTGLVACDRFGQLPVFWARTPDGQLLIAPTATAVNDLTGSPPRLSDQGIYNYLYYHMVPAPDTVFEGVHKLMAAHALFAEDGDWRVGRYWAPDFRETADASLSHAAEEMLGLLSSSVARLADSEQTGAFLSGGLDSSTVAGLLAGYRAHPTTYSIGFNADGYDEIAYARMASEHFQTDFRTYYVTPEDVLAELPRIAAAYDEPFGNSSALPAYFCARFAAEDGIKRLLAGDGGDELFAGNERYARQNVFERYGMLPGWMRSSLLEPLLFGILPEHARLVAKARSYIEQAKITLPDRLQTYNFLNRLGSQQIVTSSFLESVDADQPSQLDNALYRLPQNASRLNRMLYLDWHHTLADNDLRKVNRMCELAGIEVEYPMLDDRLVEFSTRVSSARKMPRNRLRDFFKRAVADFLPRQIIDKPKHGFGLPFGVWMAEHPGLQALAHDNLSRMRRRGYIRPEFIDEIIRRHRDQHAGYYGEFIWVLMMLELWLTAQGYEP
jgi:asparagine synthase (glutamine-hydrolysing)